MSNPLFYSESFYKAYQKTIKECEVHNVEYMLSEHLLYNCFFMTETTEKFLSCYSIAVLDKIKKELKTYLDDAMLLFSVLPEEREWLDAANSPATVMLGEYELEYDEPATGKSNQVVMLSPLLQELHNQSAKPNNSPQSPLITVESFISQLIESETMGGFILKSNGVGLKMFGEKEKVEEGSDSKLPTQIHKYCDNLYQSTIKNKIKYVYRNPELNKMAEIFSRKERNNVLILGEAGVGKTALIEQMIMVMEQRKFHLQLNKAQVLSLDMQSLIAGTKYRGEFEERMDLVVKEFINSKKQIILLLDNIHVIVGSGSSSGMDMAHFIKPLLSSPHVRVVGTTYQEKWREIIENQNGLARYFENLVLNSMSATDTKLVLKERVEEFASHHRITYADNILDKAEELSSKFLIKKPQPSAALDLLDRVGAKVARNCLIKKTEPKVSEEDLVETISEVAKISAIKIVQSENERILLLKNKLVQEVIGQDEAMEKLFQSIVVAKSGLREENKTLSTFLFVGPTGVGKTESAKIIAKELEIPLLRFDMSEYVESHSISKLIGAPPGYIGYGKGGILSEAIEENPYSVVLIDELEKASPEIYNLFLQIMDNGFFRDAQSRLINCQHTLFIMTSNLGAQAASKQNVGLQAMSQSGKQKEVVKNSLRPELINRFDAIVYFNNLGFVELTEIFNKQIEKLNYSLLKHGVKVKVSNEATSFIVENTQTQNMGARPMKRIIENQIKQPIALKILKGKMEQEVLVTLINGSLIVS